MVENKKEDIARLYGYIDELDSKKETLLTKISELEEAEKKPSNSN